MKLVDREFIETVMADDNPDFVIVLKRNTKKMPDLYDRVVWSLSEQKYIYGDERDYTTFKGEYSTPTFNDSDEHKDMLKECYRKSLTVCKSAFYDIDGKLYEIADPSKPHILLYDINEHPEYLR